MARKHIKKTPGHPKIILAVHKPLKINVPKNQLKIVRKSGVLLAVNLTHFLTQGLSLFADCHRYYDPDAIVAIGQCFAGVKIIFLQPETSCSAFRLFLFQQNMISKSVFFSYYQ
jgi:hypothetical protein